MEMTAGPLPVSTDHKAANTWISRAGALRRCEFLPHVHGNGTGGDQCHGRPFNRGTPDAEIQQSRYGIRSEARRFHRVGPVRQQALDELPPAVAEGVSGTSVALHEYLNTDRSAGWCIGDSQFDRVVGLPDGRQIGAESAARRQLDSARGDRVPGGWKVDGRIAILLPKWVSGHRIAIH
jgi:hypothetical protein